MKNILGKSFKGEKKNDDDHIKLEPAFLAQHEEVLATHGYYRRRANTDPHQPFRNIGLKKAQHVKSSESIQKPLNPIGRDGKPLLCNGCGSFRHFLKNCPDSYENCQPRVESGGNVLYVEQEVTEEEIQEALVDHYLQM